MIPFDKIELYEQFARNMESQVAWQGQTEEWTLLDQFLRGDSKKLPPYAPFHDTWFMQNMFHFITPPSAPTHFTAFDERVLQFLQQFWQIPQIQGRGHFLERSEALSVWLNHSFSVVEFEKVMHFLKIYQFDEAIIWEHLAKSYSYIGTVPQEPIDSAAATFLMTQLDKYLPQKTHFSEGTFLFYLLLRKHQDILEKYIDKFIYLEPSFCISSTGTQLTLNYESGHLATYLSEYGSARFGKWLMEKCCYTTDGWLPAIVLENLKTLAPKIYDAEKEKFAVTHLNDQAQCFFLRENDETTPQYLGNFTVRMFDILIETQGKEKAWDTISAYVEKSEGIPTNAQNYLTEKYGKQMVGLLTKTILNPKFGYPNPWETQTHALELLEKMGETSQESAVLKAFESTKDAKFRNVLVRHIAVISPENVFEKGKIFINEKSAARRLLGVQLLMALKTPEALDILGGGFETEKNDEVRDVLLRNLAVALPISNDFETAKNIVKNAEKRGKLSKSFMPFLMLSEPKLPSWKNGQSLEIADIECLAYRMSRVSEIGIDIEAKPILANIDLDSSGDFALQLLEKYFEAGGDSKQKWCMTLAARLGNDRVVDALHKKTTEWAESTRRKMAEYAVQALALNGSDKALRAIDFFSRKYKSKNKNVGAAAQNAFILAAEMLGRSVHELADLIIPNFDFDGLFKNFTIGNEEYRAFIGNDFKIYFLNEDNKTLNAIPKNASPELKNEFKNIAKELRAVVKSQSSRMEQYLVTQRRWSAAAWSAFFMGNPIMFVYAVRLVWGIFDENGALISTFQVMEDQTLLDLENEEFDLSDVAQTHNGAINIGMIHPFSMDRNDIDIWKERMSELEPIFVQLDRPVILLDPKETQLRRLLRYQGIKINGYTFVGLMEKLGWARGSVVDGGWISGYYKDFAAQSITVILKQQGEIGAGYLDANAEIGELMFVKYKSVRFGSYIYDEPEKDNDVRLLPMSDVPPLVFSEIMGEMELFKANANPEAA